MTTNEPRDPEEAVLAALDDVLESIIQQDPELAYVDGLIDELPPHMVEPEIMEDSDTTAEGSRVISYKQQFTLAPDVLQTVHEKCEELGMSMQKLTIALVHDALKKGATGKIPSPSQWGTRSAQTSVYTTELDWQDHQGVYYVGFEYGLTRARGWLISALLGAYAAGEITVTLDIDLGDMEN